MLLQLSAIAYAVMAIPLIFAPDEMAARLVPAGSPLVLQLLGAALFGFAMLNWMSRGIRIGGIYGRPLVVANLAHASVAALSLVRPVFRSGGAPPVLVALVIYSAVAVAFGSRLFVQPK
jgi:hypothetical protein